MPGSRRSLELFKNQLPGIYYLLDRNSDIIEWNKYVEEISEYSHEEIRHMNVLNEDKWSIALAVQQAIDEGYTEIESCILSKSGLRIPVYFKASKAEVDGKEYILAIGVWG